MVGRQPPPTVHRDCLVIILAERKAQAIERLTLASSLVSAALTSHAKAHGGRYVVFGSFARGDIGPDSDFDVMVDFPAISERYARNLAEAVCREHGLVPDALLKSEVSDALMRRIARDGVALP